MTVGHAAPAFLEDPQLARAVADAERYVAAAGWEQQPQLFALVPTSELLEAQPSLAGQIAADDVLTPVAQEALPPGDLADALATLVWPPAVVGCVLVSEILVLPPSAEPDLPADPTAAAAAAARHAERTEARLAVGVLREGGAACLMRLRGPHEADPLRGADLAPNVAVALRRTFVE